jgi:methionine synthase II (cobalamin-independent)
MERVRRLSAHVPSEAELGFHLCYGDFGAKHFIEPCNASRLVDVANTLARIISHPIAYIHVPVPLGRTDDGYFRPLISLSLQPATELYLGLIHVQDRVEGARQCIMTARKYADRFGLETECGMARARKPALVHALLKLHAELVREPA